MNPKKMIPAFVLALIFVTVLLICCMRPPRETGAPESADTPHISGISKNHVFHSGELRGVWVPYFSIGDGEAMSREEFEARFDDIIKTARSHSVNTLFVHVRSHCDAAYPSRIYPFSDIYRKNGRNPDYDPLEYMVDASHKAGLEFHAWINPYRISSADKTPPKTGIISEWIEEGSDEIIEYGGGLYLDPASAKARSLIIDGVRELAENYDIDGVHLDDYFYAFTQTDADAPDYEEYLQSVSNGKGALSVTQWRQANVNVLISGIYSAVKSADEQMLFGISPQGNIENDLMLGADVYEWCGKNGYIDYIAPQIYFNDENEVCPFRQTADRWKQLADSGSVHLYIGLALYKAGSDEDGGTWQDRTIIPDQIAYTRSIGADGYILYAYDQLENGFI